jgi:hypothetical protein
VHCARGRVVVLFSATSSGFGYGYEAVRINVKKLVVDPAVCLKLA